MIDDDKKIRQFNIIINCPFYTSLRQTLKYIKQSAKSKFKNRILDNCLNTAARDNDGRTWRNGQLSMITDVLMQF